MSISSPQDFVTVADIVTSLRSRWLGILATTIMLTMIVVIALLLIPNSYQSDALIYVRMGRGTVSLDPASTVASQTISLMDRRQSEINSVREMLRSRVVLDRAVKQVGVDRFLAHDTWWNKGLDQASVWFENTTNALQDKLLKQRLIGGDKTPAGMTAAEFKAQENLELAIKRLASALYIDAAKESYTLGVSVRTLDPELARDLCKAIISEYRMVHVDAHSMEGSLQFFDREYELCQQRLADAEAKLRDEKNRISLMTVIGKQELIHQEIRQLQADRLKASAELASAQGRDAEIDRKLTSLPDKLDLEQTAGVANAATDAMRNQLFELEMMEKDLVGKYSGEHPLVVQVRTKLREAKSIYEQQSGDRVLSKQALNPIRQEIELDRLRNLSALEGWKAQMEEINGKLKIAEEKATQLNTDELQINELERNVQLARNDVLTYGRKREEARLLKELDLGNFSDISVPQPPMLVYKQVAPKRSLLLALGAAGSFVLCCALAVWRGPKQKRKSLKTSAAIDAAAESDEAQGSSLLPTKAANKRASAIARTDTGDARTASRPSNVRGASDEGQVTGVALTVDRPSEPLVESH